MFSTDLLASNLLSPVVLAFALGLFARAVRSDLEVPAAIQAYLSIFLLLAIGLKGGVALERKCADQPAPADPGHLAGGRGDGHQRLFHRQVVASRFTGRCGGAGGDFGSVSAVTFIAAQQFTERSGQAADPVLVALVVALEIPAILIGLALAKGSEGLRWRQVREVLTGKTALLLIGGMAIGVISGRDGIARVDAMYVQLFQGTLMLFMLDMGMVAAGQLRSVGREAFRLATFATVVPLLHGLLGVGVGI